MSKKVVRLTEYQLRLMINKVINEQKVPAAPQKGAPQQTPTKPQANNNSTSNNETNKSLLQEALTYASKNIFVYASKFKSGYIASIRNDYNGASPTMREGSLLKPLNYNASSNKPGTHDLNVTFTQVSKENKTNSNSVRFVLNVLQSNGELMVDKPITFQEVLGLFNNGSVVIQRLEETNGVNQFYNGPGYFLYELNWSAGLTTEQGFQLLKRVVPDIGVAVINDLVRLEYQADDRERKNYFQTALKTVQNIMGQQQQQQQQQQPVNENKKRRV